jgi:hypothetical protein
LILLSALAVAWLASNSSSTALAASASIFTPARSANDLMFSFPTTSPNLYIVQTSPDLTQPWTNCQSAVVGDGTMKTVTVTDAFSASQGFYRLAIESPVKLLLPQGDAFAVLGYDCGGIKEQVYCTGFDPTNGYPTGEVSLSTTCSGSGRGSRPTTHTASAVVTWDFAGNTIFYAAYTNGPVIDPILMATDAYGDTIYDTNSAEYLAVPTPAAPTNVTAVQTNDQFDVTWMPVGVNPLAVTSSTVTATPVGSSAPTLSTNVTGSSTSAVLQPLQPATTYQITVVNTTIGGPGPASAPLTVMSSGTPIPPSAPTGVSAYWLNPDPSGTNNTLVATWQPAIPGDSPVDQYLVTITGSDNAGTFTQTVDGSTLTAYFAINDVPNWSVTVQAHNVFGWSLVSTAYHLGGQ